MSAAARNGWIDVLRALSAISVALFHFNVVEQTVPPGAPAQGWHAFWQHGHLGVGVFFTLSGYYLIPGWSRAAGAGGFLRHRAWRILPPYWCSLLFVVLVAVGIKLVTGVNDTTALPRDPLAVLATLTLLTKPATTVPTVNWAYWTLSYLLAFNLVAALPLLAARPARIYLLAAVHVGLCLTDLLAHPVPTGELFFIKHWPIFGLGAALALWTTDRPISAGLLLVSAAHAAVTLAAGRDDTHYLVTGFVTAALIVLTAHMPCPGWLRPVAGVGATSYSLYLVHVPVGIYLCWRLMPARFGSSISFIAAQLLLLAATLAGARLFYLLCERPFASFPRRSAT